MRIRIIIRIIIVIASIILDIKMTIIDWDCVSVLSAAANDTVDYFLIQNNLFRRIVISDCVSLFANKYYFTSDLTNRYRTQKQI